MMHGATMKLTVSKKYKTVHVIGKELEFATFSTKFVGHFGGKILYCILLTRHEHVSYLDIRYSYVTKLIQKHCPKTALYRRGSYLGLRLY